VLTADTYISVVPELAHDAAERIAALVIEAGCLVPALVGAAAATRERPRGWRGSVSRGFGHGAVADQQVIIAAIIGLQVFVYQPPGCPLLYR
jgi:hypothetical protein